MEVLPKHVKIKENSWLARLAALKLNTKQVAMVLGHSIHLYGVSSREFLNNQHWVNHELKHVQQYKRLGFARFLILYLWYSLRYGYFENPLEKEARGEKV